MKQKQKSIYYKYSILFLLICTIVYLPYLFFNKSFVWHDGLWNDGFNQHYSVFVYLGRYYRGIIYDFFRGDFTIPQFDFSIGLGEGILPVLNYYGLGDVFTLFSTLVPPKYSHIMYSFLVLLRLYLSGLSFIYMSVRYKYDYIASILGSFIYIFCGYALFESVRHPFFLNPMIYLPLICVGVTELIKSQKNLSYHLVIPLFLSALSGFYFTYMLSAFVFIYAILLLICKKSKHPILLFSKVIINYLCSIFLSSVIFVPSVIAFLSSSRSGSLNLNSIFGYNSSEALAYTLGTFIPMISDTSLGINIFVIPSIIVLFRNKNNKLLKSALIICVLAFFIPVGGFIMNGFSYSANRWSFIFSFLLAIIFCKSYPLIKSEKYKNILPYAVCITVCLNGFCIYQIQNYKSDNLKNTKVYKSGTATYNNYYRNDFKRSNPANKYHENIGVLKDKPSISEYFSITNPYYTEFLDKLQISPAFITSFKLNGVDNRIAAESLLCTEKSWYKNTSNKRINYMNSSTLPLMYAYKNTISTTIAESLTPLQRQTAMTTHAIIDNGDNTTLKMPNEDIAFKCFDNFLEFDITDPSEVYISLDISNLCENTNITFKTHNKTKELFVLNDSHRYALKKKSYMVNLGKFTEGKHIVYIKKNSDAIINITNIAAHNYILDLDNLQHLSRAYSVNINKNTVSSYIYSDGDSTAVLSVPYSKGWRIEIDGVPTESFLANYAFIGVKIPSGFHDITMTYTTPGLSIGIILSLVGILILILLSRKKKNSNIQIINS